MNPHFSIITPTFNRADVITRSVKSVLSQSYTDFELIIVDDGSKDDTYLIIQGIKDERIRYFKLEVNSGQNPALNFGVSQVRGMYVAFLDSDDEWLPDFLEKVELEFRKDKSLGVVYTKAYGCTNDGTIYNGYQFHLQGEIYKEVLRQGYMSYMITIVVKREIIDRLQSPPFDPSFVYGQDDDFCFRVAKICKVGLIPEPLAIIHNDGDAKGNEPSISRNTKLVAEGRQKLIDKYRDDIIEFCGKEVLAKKYLLLSKLYIQSGDVKMAGLSARLSYHLHKSTDSVIKLIYCNNSFIRWIWNHFEVISSVIRNTLKGIIIQFKTVIKKLAKEDPNNKN